MARDFDLARKVSRYYRDRTGLDIHYKDAAAELGINPPDNVSTYLARTVQRHPEYGFTRTGTGIYRYTPYQRPEVNSTVPDMVEIVGFMEDKTTMIVRDESGSLSLWRRVQIPN